MSADLAHEAARRLLLASESDWPAEFDRLLRAKELTSAIRSINAMLQNPELRPLAESALRRMGLWVDQS